MEIFESFEAAKQVLKVLEDSFGAEDHSDEAICNYKSYKTDEQIILMRRQGMKFWMQMQKFNFWMLLRGSRWWF